MSDKILKEAFDKMVAIEEGASNSGITKLSPELAQLIVQGDADIEDILAGEYTQIDSMPISPQDMQVLQQAYQTVPNIEALFNELDDFLLSDTEAYDNLKAIEESNDPFCLNEEPHDRRGDRYSRQQEWQDSYTDSLRASAAYRISDGKSPIYTNAVMRFLNGVDQNDWNTVTRDEFEAWGKQNEKYLWPKGNVAWSDERQTFALVKPIDEASGDDLHTKAIDLLDDMLASSGDDYYGEKGEILRYAIKRLQEVGERR